MPVRAIGDCHRSSIRHCCSTLQCLIWNIKGEDILASCVALPNFALHRTNLQRFLIGASLSQFTTPDERLLWWVPAQIAAHSVTAFEKPRSSGAFCCGGNARTKRFSLRTRLRNVTPRRRGLSIKAIGSFGGVWPSAGRNCSKPNSAAAPISTLSERSGRRVRFSQNGAPPNPGIALSATPAQAELR